MHSAMRTEMEWGSVLNHAEEAKTRSILDSFQDGPYRGGVRKPRTMRIHVLLTSAPLGYNYIYQGSSLVLIRARKNDLNDIATRNKDTVQTLKPQFISYFHISFKSNRVS